MFAINTQLCLPKLDEIGTSLIYLFCSLGLKFLYYVLTKGSALAYTLKVSLYISIVLPVKYVPFGGGVRGWVCACVCTCHVMAASAPFSS